MSTLTPDLHQAAQFLEMLDPDAQSFTFQVFDDGELKRGHLAKSVHGELENEATRLAAWQIGGAGVFVTINETDGTGRRAENITRVRAVFVDLDGAPLAPVLTCRLEPHIIVESSPGRYHAYWIVDGLPRDQFEGVQRAIAVRFNGDPKVHDLSRVMRVPGFVHQKAEPFMTRVHGVWPRMPYKAEQILAEFPPGRPEASANGHDRESEPLADLIRQILTGDSYHAPLCSLAWRHLSDGMAPGKVVLTLRGLMDASTGPRDDRWQARYTEIPRTVSTAQGKLNSGVPHPAQPLLDKIAGQSQPAETAGRPPFVPAEDFIAGFAAKRPLIREWDLKPGWVYTFTAPPGSGKTTISLVEAVQLVLSGKRVVYLAGENADDVRARVILMKAKLQLTELPEGLWFVDRTFDLHKGFEHVRGEVARMGGADLIYVDTSPAFMMASGHLDENDNAQGLQWALRLRKLSHLEGRPAVVALCHPTKRPLSVADCLPRGGSSLLAEVDGNYAAWPVGEADGQSRYFELTWAGKFRGSFEPLVYRAGVASCDGLRDEDGNPVKSVWGSRANNDALDKNALAQVKDDDAVLAVMSAYPGQTLREWAERLGWTLPSGPNGKKVQRSLERLSEGQGKRVRKERGAYMLTNKGKEEAAELRAGSRVPTFHPTGAERAATLLGSNDRGADSRLRNLPQTCHSEHLNSRATDHATDCHNEVEKPDEF